MKPILIVLLSFLIDQYVLFSQNKIVPSDSIKYYENINSILVKDADTCRTVTYRINNKYKIFGIGITYRKGHAFQKYIYKDKILLIAEVKETSEMKKGINELLQKYYFINNSLVKYEITETVTMLDKNTPSKERKALVILESDKIKHLENCGINKRRLRIRNLLIQANWIHENFIKMRP